MELLVARGLVLWRSGVKLFGPLDLNLQAGMRVALTGYSGSGLSSLLELLAGRQEATDGMVQRAPGARVGFAGQNQNHQLEGTVWQQASRALAPLVELEQQLRRAEQNLDSEAALFRYGELAAAFEAAGGYAGEAELGALLEEFGLGGPLLQTPAEHLSGGQLRRLGLVRALTGRPEILLLDTPDAGLDSQARELLARRLRSWPGAVVFSSHDRHFINLAASHVAELRDFGLAVRRGGFPLLPKKRAPAAAGQGQRLLLSTESLKLPLGDAHLQHSQELQLGTGERIALLGPNGSGKSSLLGHIAGDLHHGQGDSGLTWHGRVSLLYVDQADHGLDRQLGALDNLSLRMSRQRARQLLGLVRLPPSRWQVATGALTSGERARAGLALALADESDVLLLDELDAQLDLAGITLLEDTLLARPGALIMVSHDRQLADNVANRVWTLSESGLKDWRGGMEGYRGGRLRREERLQLAAVTAPVPPITEVEPTLEELEDELARIDDRLADQLSLPERQVQRLERRRLELIEQLMLLYDAQFEPPRPRFQALESGLRLEADLTADGSGLEFTGVAGTRPVLLLQAGIAHLRLDVPADRCLLPVAKRALLNAATRLAFHALPTRVVQYWDPDAPAGLLLDPAGSEWHALARTRFERLEGWTAPARRRRRRRRRKVKTP